MKDRQSIEANIDYDDKSFALHRIHSTDMSCFPRISPAEEIVLANLRDRGLRAKLKLDTGKFKNSAEKQILIAKVEEGKRAVDKLITSNYKLATHLARACLPILTEMTTTETSNGVNVSFSDLVQTGYVGLIEATHKFDQKRGVKFSTYACLIMLQKIYETLSFNTGLEHSRKDYTHVSMVQGAITKLITSLGRYPTEDEISKQAGLGKRRIKNIIILFENLVLDSLYSERISDDGDELYLYDTISSNTFLPTEEQAIQNIFTEKLREAIFDEISRLVKQGSLDPNAARVLFYFYGFADGISKTLQETADKFGLNSRQIINIWLNNAQRQPSKSPQLRLFLENL